MKSSTSERYGAVRPFLKCSPSPILLYWHSDWKKHCDASLRIKNTRENLSNKINIPQPVKGQRSSSWATCSLWEAAPWVTSAHPLEPETHTHWVTQPRRLHTLRLIVCACVPGVCGKPPWSWGSWRCWAAAACCGQSWRAGVCWAWPGRGCSLGSGL